MEYKVVYADNIELHHALNDLENKVRELLKDGWSLQGGISIFEQKCGWYYACQSMVKHTFSVINLE